MTVCSPGPGASSFRLYDSDRESLTPSAGESRWNRRASSENSARAIGPMPSLALTSIVTAGPLPAGWAVT